MTFTICAITFFLLVEIFFSGSEIALVVVDKVRLKARMKSGHKGAAAATWFIKHPAHFFSTVILGTNISVVAASTLATFYLISNFGESSEIWALLLSPVVLIFGEVLPKALFQHYADRLVERISPPLMASMYALYPIVWVLSGFTRFLLGGVEHHFGAESRITREELAIMIGSADSSDVKPSERKMVSKILELANQRAKNVMVPLALIESIPITAKRETALSIFDLKGFSKLPVFETKAYNIVGVLDCMDCLFSEGAELKDFIRPVLYIPKSMNLHKLYLLMKEKEQQIAIVVDEYGASVGLITMEDLLEEIVGDIKDEYEIGRQHWRIIGLNHFLVSGRAEIEEVNEKLGLQIPKGHYETIAGFLLDESGHIPLNGEQFIIGKWRYIIKETTAKAIMEIEVTAI
ncbi:MAG: HlyC/CorC family transporter [Deltaproteobacteria bacterium]|nr:HlyC/CorC family transporter [Deltaproteobacteria bacterium]